MSNRAQGAIALRFLGKIGFLKPCPRCPRRFLGKIGFLKPCPRCHRSPIFGEKSDFSNRAQGAQEIIAMLSISIDFQIIIFKMTSPRFRPESKIYLGRLGVGSPRFILDVSESGVQDLSWTSRSSESKIYLRRLGVGSPRFILDI
jgi:hypothetical protein